MVVSRNALAFSGRILLALLLAGAGEAGGCAKKAQDAYSAVDPFIGTEDGGHTFPGATVPFGMIQLSPDTQIRYFKQSYPWAAGYQYKDPTILGFSHTHFSGSGHSDLGDVLMQPIAGDVRLEPGDQDKPLSGYRSRFSHDTEKAEPGYYAVTLSDYGVRAELTTTTRVGLHRYTFPADKPAHVLVDLRSSIYNLSGQSVVVADSRIRPDGTVTGFTRNAWLGTGAAAVFRHALLQRSDGTAFLRSCSAAGIRPEIRAVGGTRRRGLP